MGYHKWLILEKCDLATEREQCIEEGKDIGSLADEFDALSKLDLENDLSLRQRSESLLDKTIKLPLKKDYPFNEPSDLAGIRELSEMKHPVTFQIDDSIARDKIHGAWLGRVCGCLLGKPVEGWMRSKIHGYLKDQGRFPLKEYFRSDIDSTILEKHDVKRDWPFINNLKKAPEDDDTNYTVAGMAMMKQYGKDFTSQQMMDFWLTNIPVLSTCTAERIAYRNFLELILPPASATFRNPYREWIGAQIRADFFGYAAIGNPHLAAEFAHRDASISHVKNGIYGEMWMAAMISSAATSDNMEEIIRTGLSVIPRTSRLHKHVSDVVSWRKENITYTEAIEQIHKRWDEKNPHHWCHTISNAEIVAMALLWGENDFGKTICRAVEACFDTDCNGASAGSIIGMVLGARKVPKHWVKPYNGRFLTAVSGYRDVLVKDMAEESFRLYKKFRG